MHEMNNIFTGFGKIFHEIWCIRKAEVAILQPKLWCDDKG